MSDAAAMGTIVVGFLAVIGAIMLAVMTGAYYVDRSSCHSFGNKSNREVRWVKYNLVSWDCLTPTADGKWISTDKLRDID